MKIKVDGSEITARDINYKQKLELQGEFADVYSNGSENVKQKDFNSLLGSTAEIAFQNPKEYLKQFDYDFQLKILTAILMNYMELSDSSKKENGD
jgi:hypothetical protein